MKSKNLSIKSNFKTAFLILTVYFSLSAMMITAKAQTLSSNKKAVQSDFRELGSNDALYKLNNDKTTENKIVSVKLEVLRPKVSFQNGESDFIKSIGYPKGVIENKIKGVVDVFFKVEPNGKATDIRILKSLDYDCDQAVLKAIHKANFVPDVIGGKAVTVRCILPVYFGLDPAEVGDRDIAETLPDNILKEKIYDNSKNWLDRTVSYKNGKSSFASSVVYPQDAIDHKVEGLVKAFFVVEPDGHTSNIRILKSLNYECDQSVIKAIHKVQFKPGMINGKAVRVHCILPVYFGLNGVN